MTSSAVLQLYAPISQAEPDSYDYRFIHAIFPHSYPGYEHLKWEAIIQKMEPERLFSFTWHPYAVDSNKDYSQEAPTLVEFRLEKIASGTLILLTESGFGHIPSDRRPEAFRMNEGGWTEQMKNIERHVTKEPYTNR
jgi:uncharacterized protein YndB with AHSA1/START domain